jgi:hypothetical protein
MSSLHFWLFLYLFVVVRGSQLTLLGVYKLIFECWRPSAMVLTRLPSRRSLRKAEPIKWKDAAERPEFEFQTLFVIDLPVRNHRTSKHFACLHTIRRVGSLAYS